MDQFPLPSLLPFLCPLLLSTTCSTHSSVSVQKEAGLSWVSTKHGISSFCNTKHLPIIKAGKDNPVSGKASQSIKDSPCSHS